MTEYYSRLQYTAVHHTTVGKDAKQCNRINIVTTNTHLQSSTKTKLRVYKHTITMFAKSQSTVVGPVRVTLRKDTDLHISVCLRCALLY